MTVRSEQSLGEGIKIPVARLSVFGKEPPGR